MKLLNQQCSRCGNRWRRPSIYRWCADCREWKRRSIRANIERDHVIGTESAAAYVGIAQSSFAHLVSRGVVKSIQSYRGRLIFTKTCLDALKACGYGSSTDHVKKNARLIQHGGSICPSCGIVFIGNSRAIYCTARCKQKAINDRYYDEHREEIIKRAKNRSRK